MGWLIIPAMVLALTFIAFLVTRHFSSDEAEILPVIIGAFLLIITLIGCPASYYSTRNSALSAEAYYEEVALPHMVSEGDDYIVVESLGQGIWQSGEMNLAEYNSYLKTTRYWDSIPIIGSTVYAPPDNLKYVRVK